jgi:type VI secretion system protein ImpE
MDSSTGPMREMVGHALRCELLRAAVFEGRRTPMVFGQPDEWLALLIESLLQTGQGDSAMSHQLAERAFEAAPATRGQLNGEPFEWIADADSRLGPVLEAMVNGKYYWIPFSRLSRVSIEAPTDLRDHVWLPAQISFSNGGEAIAMIPTRYPGSQASEDGEMRLARKTEWRELRPEVWAGYGQRVIGSDAGEYALMDVREILFTQAADSAGADAQGTAGDGAGPWLNSPRRSACSRRCSTASSTTRPTSSARATRSAR